MEKSINIEEICKKDLLKLLSEIEQNYSYGNSLINVLIENQEKTNEVILGIENEKAKKKIKIYLLEDFKKKIKEPIEKYLTQAESKNILLDDIKQALNNFLFQIEYQFGNYLSSKKIELIFKESGEKNSKEEMFQKMYGEAQKADTVLEYIILRTRIKEIIQSILLISSIFEMEQIKNKFLKEVENSQKKIDEVGTKIDFYNKELSSQKSELQKNNESIEKQDEELKKNKKKIDDHDKRILEMMGIFLSIFSLIGVNLSFFSKIKDVSVWNILLLVIVINVSLSETIKVIFSVIRKEKVETIAEKIFKTIVNCIKEKTK
ncbi:hypothetical protein [Leptotrichia hongkongensis]|uniref:hypothetical protein n=1 Tax=Leptotrichia hongkongensis TaxID=554406 RepID=UPI0035A85965